eukprot:166931-Chlamydomonas_euryale.AAC.3
MAQLPAQVLHMTDCWLRPRIRMLALFLAAALQGKSPHDAAQQWRVSMSVATSLLLASAVLFAAAALKSIPGSDFRPSSVSLGDAHTQWSASMHEGDEDEEDEEEGEKAAEEEANSNNPSRTLLRHGGDRGGGSSRQTA